MTAGRRLISLSLMDVREIVCGMMGCGEMVIVSAVSRPCV